MCGFFRQVKFATSLLASLAGGLKHPVNILVTGFIKSDNLNRDFPFSNSLIKNNFFKFYPIILQACSLKVCVPGLVFWVPNFFLEISGISWSRAFKIGPLLVPSYSGHSSLAPFPSRIIPKNEMGIPEFEI